MGSSFRADVNRQTSFYIIVLKILWNVLTLIQFLFENLIKTWIENSLKPLQLFEPVGLNTADIVSMSEGRSVFSVLSIYNFKGGVANVILYPNKEL